MLNMKKLFFILTIFSISLNSFSQYTYFSKRYFNDYWNAGYKYN